MTQHSPEPWTVEETTSNHYYTRGRKGLQVRVSEYNAIDIPGPMSEESTRANAALIAAAPDLLAALQDLMAVEGGEPNRPPPWMTEELLTPWLKAINAIAKATQEVTG